MSTITDTWTIDGAGNWSTGTDWFQVVNNNTLHQQPNSGNDAVLSPSGTTPFVVTYNETDTVNSLAGNQYATLDLTGGTLTIDTNAGFSGGVVNQAGTLVLVNGWSETGASGLGTAAAYVIEAGAFVIGSGATTDTLAGTVSGAGNFYLNNASSFILAQGFKISSGTWELSNGNDGFGSNTTLDTDVGYTGIFKLDDYSGNAANLFLNGETLTLAGTQFLDGYISGTGTLAQSGTAEASQLTINNNALVIVNGTVNQDGGVTIGNGTTPDTTSLDIEGVWAFTTDTSLTGYGASTIDNEGTIVKNGGSTSSTISGNLFIENGVLTAGTATLSISAATNEIAGLLNGAGNIYFAGGESFTLDPGVSITSAIWELGVSGNGSRSSTTLDTNVTYAGTFRLDNNTGNPANLYLNNEVLTLSGGASLNGYIGGPGKIAITGSADIIGEGADGGVVFSVTGLLTQDGGFNLGGKMLVGATGTYDLRSNDGITNNDTVSIVNAGLIEKTAGTGSSILNGGASSTGTVDVATGTLGFSGSGGSLSGTIEGAGTFLLGGNGTYTLASTLVATVSTILISDYDSSTSLVFGGNITYGGTFDTSLTFGNQNFDLAGYTFDLTNAGAINTAYDTLTFSGGGELLLGPASNIEMYEVNFGGGVMLENQGSLTEGYAITLDSDSVGGASTLQNDVGATFVLVGGGTAVNNGGTTGVINNAGLIVKNTGTGGATISGVQIANSGTILVSSGGLTLGGSVAGAGTLAIGANSALALSSATTNTIAFQGAGATLYLGSAVSVTGAITGLASGDTIDLQGVGFVGGSYAAGSGTVGALTAGTRTFTVDGAYGGLYFNSQSDGNGGTDIVVSSVPGASSSTPPATTSSFTSTTASQIETALAALLPSGATPYVVSVTGAAFSAPSVPGTLNVLVATTSAAGATLVLPTGFLAGYLLSGAATLEDSVGGALLVDEASGGNLQGAANDTLFGGDSPATLSATTGAETLIGGTATTLFFLGGSNAFVSSQGTDTIIGSSAADTVNATAAALYFGTSGSSVVNVQGASTIIGGTGGNTVTGGGGNQLIFGSSSLDYIGGAGSATIIGGGGGNTVTGGSGNLLIFASSSLTYNGTGGAATIIGGGGPVNAFLGAGGGIAYGSPAGNDTLASGSGLSILVGGGGGDLLVASGAANDTLVAGGGNETLTGSGSTGSLVLFGGPGNDVLAGGTGNDLFIAEPGNATMTGGGGTNSYVFISTPGTTRTDVITDFNPNQDAIGLFGYGAEPGADAAALASATSSGGNTVVTLSDGTSIVMVGAPTLHSYNFF
jgi:Ca2+-binding RTX toxin-like protein